jgi:hypothetical protein
MHLHPSMMYETTAMQMGIDKTGYPALKCADAERSTATLRGCSERKHFWQQLNADSCPSALQCWRQRLQAHSAEFDQRGRVLYVRFPATGGRQLQHVHPAVHLASVELGWEYWRAVPELC